MVRLNERFDTRAHWSEAARLERLGRLRQATQLSLPNLATPIEDAERLQGRIENFIGMVRLPVGVAGPLTLRGSAAHGAFYVPLATTEGTLVLAVSRGAEAIAAGGGAQVHAGPPQVTRAPLFVFATHEAARAAARFAVEHEAELRTAAEATTTHGCLLAIVPSLYGRRLVLEFVFHPADAAGQNMVTFATDASCRWLRQQPEFGGVEFYAIESNASLDKKVASLAPSRPRGRHVSAEVTIPAGEVARLFRTTPAAMARVAREGTYACVVAGTVGAQAQFANVLAALFVATGQDVATVAECGTGLTIIEETAAGDLYASVTLPNLIVGTVGGGTELATQRECLALLGCAGPDRAQAFAEIAAATVLAGELSLVASLASDTFVQAHAALGRPHRDTAGASGR